MFGCVGGQVTLGWTGWVRVREGLFLSKPVTKAGFETVISQPPLLGI